MTQNTDSACPKGDEVLPGNSGGGDFSHLDLSTQSLMETIPVPCLLIDQNGLFIAGNKAFYKLTAGSGNLYVKQDPYTLLTTPDQAEHFRKIDRRLLEGRGNIAHEATILTGRGPAREVIFKKTLLRDDTGARVGILIAVMDLSELVEVKSALFVSESEKQAIIDGFPGILCLFDVDEKLIWANGKLRDLHPDPVGRTCHEIFCGKSSSCNSCAVPLGSNKEATQSTIQQFEMRTAGGEERVYELTGTPVKDNDGNVLSVVVIGRDVTEKNKLEKQLRHTQKMEAIGTLAGGIAHDFNNVLTPIMGYSEIIRLSLLKGESDDESMLEYIDGILKAANRAKSLVEQILTFSRSSEQKETPQHIHPIVKEVMKLMRVTLPKTISIQEKIDEGCGRVSADPTKVHQILINLCTNSAHAMDGKHGTLAVSLARTGLNDEGKQWLCLSVADTGSGIAPEIQHRIFEPYFTTKEKTRGTGMGLAMVHGIVTRMGGRIEVQSMPNEGTTFYVYLPVSNEPVRIEQIINTANFKRGSASVLVVDDESQVVTVTSELLASLGYKVTSRTSSLEALKLVSEDPLKFDLVLTDQIMPGLTGVELAGKLKKIRKDLPVVMFTGYSEGLSPEDAREAGIDQYCMKPVSLRDLSDVLHETLQKTN